MRATLRPARKPLAIPPRGTSEPGRPCVVHLVRAVNGKAPFEAFLNALRRCPPGAEHDLVLAMKGFASKEQARPYLEVAEELSAETLFFSDAGLDLSVYFALASQLQRERYCFLNSFSEPLVEGWLAKLDAAIREDAIGIAGATGSWNSSRSWVLYALGMPSAYRGVLPPRASVRKQFQEMDAERSNGASGRALSAGGDRGAAHRLASTTVKAAKMATRALSEVPRQMLDFELFPAQHVRTNAFMIAHETLAHLHLHQVQNKTDAYLLESGRESITRQIQRLGLRTVVVDRAGRIYDRDHWHESVTFCQSSQEGLLVADNQTRLYENGGVDRRRMLSAMAWGGHADPTA
jgi:hypothetical protein